MRDPRRSREEDKSRGARGTRVAINRQINATEVRLVGAQGEQMGVVSLTEALVQAERAELDLVEISPQAVPPVCKIMNFGKYLFEQRKKSKNRAKRVQLKEIKLRPVTDIGDYLVKTKRAIAFLQDGDKVKFVVRFRGRELSYQQQGHDILTRIAEDLGDHGVVEQTAKIEGKQMIMIMIPGKTKK